MGSRGQPSHQLHAQAVLLPRVVAVNLLLDLLQCGQVRSLLCGFADILEQTQKQGWVCSGSQDKKGSDHTLPQAP